jgi:YD repeat-containing protein
MTRHTSKLLIFISTTLMAQSPQGRDRFVGSWKLLSCELKAVDGKISYPYGEQPVGRLSYDKAGRIQALLMRPGRPATYNRDSLGQLSPQDMREVLRGFAAYYGTFDVDESTKTVIHHVKASIYPSNVGTDLKRTFEFTENRLILNAVIGQGVMRLMWEREPD